MAGNPIVDVMVSINIDNSYESFDSEIVIERKNTERAYKVHLRNLIRAQLIQRTLFDKHASSR